jgi:hypothetical protein
LSPKKNIRRKKLGKEIAKFYISADMSDSVKKKKTTQCPLFYGGFSFYMQVSATDDFCYTFTVVNDS